MSVKFTCNKEQKISRNAAVVANHKSGLTDLMPEQESGKAITIMIL